MNGKPVTIDDAVEEYFVLEKSIGSFEQGELRRLARWIGKTTRLSNIGPVDIERYGYRFSHTDPEYPRRLEVLRKFLTFARDSSWTTKNLSIHIKTKKGKTKASGVSRMVKPELAVLTRQGYDDILSELTALKNQRPHLLDEIRKAAADKDFRENAPLQAAREQLGHMDGRIQDLSSIIKSAKIIGGITEEKGQVVIGNTVTLVEAGSGQNIKFTIVGTKEAKPAEGKISHVSPLGKALIGRTKGDITTVNTPAGSRQYSILEIQK